MPVSVAIVGTSYAARLVDLKILDNPATSSTSSLIPDDSAGRATLWHPAVQMHDAEVAAGP
jgi:hypothetical protein